MKALHDALGSLRPTKWSDIPVDDLAGYLHETFAQAELIISSVPPLPATTTLENAAHAPSSGYVATRSSEMTMSGARPLMASSDSADMAKAWGKPVKINDKDNPLGLQIHKMAGHDRHGAWFARRSVHEGLDFTKWKRAMQSEFAESLKVQAGPGAGSIRGIGGDRRIERREVDGAGTMEVYALSAKFPPPTAPRDFVTLLLTSDNALTDKSALITGSGSRTLPRHWMVVSVPCEHPDAPERPGLVRGTYESVEIIREIPLTVPATHSTPDLLALEQPETTGRPRSSTSGQNLQNNVAAPGRNAVEWVMVTRSDPGGGIPRFLVERGTPPSIAADAVKFLDWACARDEAQFEQDSTVHGAHEGADRGRRSSSSSLLSHSVPGVEALDNHSEAHSRAVNPGGPSDSCPPQSRSLVDQVGQALGKYAPDAIQQGLPSIFSQANQDSISDDISTDTSSVDSFASAEPFYTAGTRDLSKEEASDSVSGQSKLEDLHSSDVSGISLAQVTGDSVKSKTSSEGASKELAKIDEKKRQLEAKLAASKEKWEKEGQRAHAKSVEDAEKQRARHEREIRKRQERYDKEMRRLEERAEKEARKAKARKRRELEKDASVRVQRERDEFKQRVGILEEENKVLLTQLGEIQRVNTNLVAKLGKAGLHPTT